MAAVTSSSSSSLALSGLASGINWTNIINDMVQAESAPITTMQGQQTTLNSENTSYQTIGTDLTNLQNDITTLTTPGFFQSATTGSSDSSVATATAASGAPTGTYSFSVSQLATAAVQEGTTVTAQPLSTTSDVSNVTLSTADFSEPITNGSFTVDGKIITVATSDTLAAVCTQINTATGGAVTASYNPATDELTLSSSTPISLGSSADTSNFLQATQLYTNGGDTVTSLGPLSAISLTAPASQSNLSTPITDGGGGQGAFEINGVTINYDSSTDSIDSVLQSINNSAAGVTASYDGANHRFVLTNSSTGNLGVTMQDVTGNFLAATGISSGTLTAGTNLQYSLDGSNTMTSESNTIDATSDGLTGLSITAQSTGQADITVSPDTSTMATAITQFVNDYNTVQNYISSQTTVSTSTSSSTGSTDSTTTSTGTPGVLMGDMDAEGIATNLRQLVDASPLSGIIENLNDIGIASNGNDNTLSVNSDVLNDSLSNNLSQVSQLFTDPTSGLATTVGSYLTDTLASNGLVKGKEQSFTSQSQDITNSITTLQQKITSDETEMENQFVEMEDAISSINISKEYLTAYFDAPASTTAAPVAQNDASNTSTSTDSSL
ncbi:MAG TPA: flagellar filament capping protein FliD [Verrucomicrobiae bacterium]|nr:flagellar filament capping protein FliD [Verrucomicrobiae bacterium]